ncbi:MULTISPECIES: type II toxin-antitoxin system RelE/ParE family toxin [Arenibacter]|uniref:Plasmid stabilization system protein ParE n=1 Tax=Arenibacter palladensis TaxID=237373 RepID=A0A1M4T6F5_9FLAO|nr:MULTISPECIES: type II toxin-antitoxin system RelE/ParE family toxin [Arenibacter]MCK0133016.1 type II toxin-antitoxin system RelE/ParE family toxin [Arenibacter sp. S6351L]SHE40031.1 Plasmid stabilization system protein ParE [Arenibacter palladensis]
MGLEIFWTGFAEDQLHCIFKHYQKKAGNRIAKKLVDGIFNEPSKLKIQPEIGQIEELLRDRELGFRYLIYKKNYKIIYWINEDENRVEIIDVFDVRQYPLKIRRSQ